MQFGQPPSWRPDHDQLRAEACRGTVRDALGGLRNLEQLLGSLRVGPRALLSVMPDVQACCTPLTVAIGDLASLVATKLAPASEVVTKLSAFAEERIKALSEAFDSIGKTTFNAKARLRLEEVVSSTARDVECVFELIDLLGEVAWGRTMPISLEELAREAFRPAEPPPTTRGTVRIALSTAMSNTERELCPRAIVLLLNQLARFGANGNPTSSLGLTFRETESHSVEATLRPLEFDATAHGHDGSEVRWAIGTHVLKETEQCLRISAAAMRIRLDLTTVPGETRLFFDAESAE